jgi:hypothetical protein
MKGLLMCAMLAGVGGAGRPEAAVKPAVLALAVQAPADPARPAQPGPDRGPLDTSLSVCTIVAVPADPSVDPEFAKPLEQKVDPGMVAPSRCRR